MSKGSSSWLVPMAVLLLLWGVAFSMAAQLTINPLNLLSGDTSVAERLLGASRVAFGSSFFNEADNYFHKGVGHVHQKAFSDDYFQTLKAAIEPSGHVHPEGIEVSEIMPWLRFTTKMDPNNVDAYLTTAFWLEGAIQRPDVAEAVLREAQLNNPKDYRVINARAKMLFGTGDDGKAAVLLDTAIKLWPSSQDPEDQQARLDLAQMLSYRAFLCELKSDRTNALDLFKRAYAAMPDNKALEQRIAALERGEDCSGKDRQIWEALFAQRHVCAREGEDHDHDEEHEDDHDHGMNE
jgi:tetratricopeptide (TPR) repeat protein